jgi:hypothetical protein
MPCASVDVDDRKTHTVADQTNSQAPIHIGRKVDKEFDHDL